MTSVSRRRYAAAGALGALAWALQQPLDKRALRYGYDDVVLLAHLLPRAVRGNRMLGLLAHLTNGAVFGLAYAEVLRRRRGREPRATAWTMAMVEHVALFPLGLLIDRRHPAVRRGRLDPIFTPRGFVLETWRHAILGAVLAEVAARDPALSTGRRLAPRSASTRAGSRGPSRGTAIAR